MDKQVVVTIVGLACVIGVTLVVVTGVPVSIDMFAGGSPGESDTDGPIGSTTYDPLDPATLPGTLDAQPTDFAPFRAVTESIGIDYETRRFSRAFVGHYGVYVADINNNGYEDLLLIGGDYPTLYVNTMDGFEADRVFAQPDATVAHFFDYNNNGHRDLLLGLRGAPPVLYENHNGEFVEQADAFDRTLDYPTTMTSADFTGNGCLDIYIGQWGSPTGSPAVAIGEMRDIAAAHPEHRPTTSNGNPNHLFAGDCVSFTEITDQAGIGGEQFTLAVSAADFTGNGHIDLHVGNDWTGDYIHENLGNATFETIDLGPASDRNAMSSVVQDMTGNHLPDIFVTNVYFENAEIDDLIPLTRTPLPDGNNLFANQGDGSFIDIAKEHDLHRGSWGWAATIADYTNDGHLDVIHSSTYVNVLPVHDHADIFEPPQVWKGTGDTWEKVHGFDLGFDAHNIRGIARIDYRNNGVLDVVMVGNPAQMPGVSNDDRQVHVYENTLVSNESLQLFVRNPTGLEQHSKVYVETDQRTIFRLVNARSDLLSQDSRLIHIGTANEQVERVVVVWPDGSATEYESLVEGSRYILTPAGAEEIERPEA